MTESSSVDWREYYDREGETKQFLPEKDPAEAMRVEFVQRLLVGIDVGSELDVGCGNGYLASRLGREGTRTVGMDFSRPRLRDGATRFPWIRFLRGSAVALPFRDDDFDTVTLVEVLEHLPEPTAALRELARVARRQVVVTVPYRGKIVELVCPHCLKSYHHDGHIHSFDEDKLAGMVREAGLRLVRLDTYTPYYPPQNPLARRLPASLHRALRGLAVAARLKPAVRPKYLGILAVPAGS